MIVCSAYPAPRGGRRARYVAAEHFNRAERRITRDVYRAERQAGVERGVAFYRALQAGNLARTRRNMAARFGTKAGA